MEETKTVRLPASQYILLDSRDRNQSTTQPWNNFVLQKPQALLDAFAKRIMVSEVRFPWYIPNITEFNNSLDIVLVDSSVSIVVPIGFYSPQSLVSTINNLLSVNSASPILSYDNLSNRYSFNASSVDNTFTLLWTLPQITLTSQVAFNNQASLFKTLGFAYEQSTTDLTNVMVGTPTQTLYTSYVDIVSTRIMRLSKVRDGDSANNSQCATLMRIYLADEASFPYISYSNTQDGASGADVGNFPFTIHRQFKTPKAILWSPDLFVDYLDISVVDEYNNLVPLQTQLAGTTPFQAQYPDFQITLLASE